MRRWLLKSTALRGPATGSSERIEGNNGARLQSTASSVIFAAMAMLLALQTWFANSVAPTSTTNECRPGRPMFASRHLFVPPRDAVGSASTTDVESARRCVSPRKAIVLVRLLMQSASLLHTCQRYVFPRSGAPALRAVTRRHSSWATVRCQGSRIRHFFAADRPSSWHFLRERLECIRASCD